MTDQQQLVLMNEWLDRNAPSQAVEEFARRLAGIAVMDASGVNTAVLEIMHNILTAEGEEAVFAAANAGTESGKTFLDSPFRLRSDAIEWKASAAMYREQGGFPFYSLLRLTRLDNDRPLVLTCGGFTFITTLWALWDQNILDRYDVYGGMPLVIKAKTAASGFDFLMLHRHVVPNESATEPAPTKKATASKAK